MPLAFTFLRSQSLFLGTVLGKVGFNSHTRFHTKENDRDATRPFSLVDSLTKNWNQFLDTILDWAPQLQYSSSDSENAPDYAMTGLEVRKRWANENVGTSSQ